VSNAAVLLPMSHSTASDLESMLGARPERLTVVPPVLEPGFRPAAAEEIANCRAKYGLPDAFWLYVAHMYPHKNHERLLRAYRSVKSVMPSAWPLVLRGDPTPALPDLAGLVAELGLSHEVLLLPRLGRTELPALYSAASALVFPSIYEGAGIPVLEAIACGCPLLASGIPAVREFAGDAARYFDPLDVDQMAGEMLAFAANAEQRRFLSRQGLDRAAGFRASDGIDGLTTAYRLAAGCGRNRATSSL